MRKKLAIPFVAIIMIAVSMTGAQVNLDRQVSLDSTAKSNLATKGITSWSYEDYIGDDEMYRCLISPNDYNLPCSGMFYTYWMNCTKYEDSNCVNEERVNHTSAEKYDMLDRWEKERMEQIGNAIKDRRERTEIEKTREGSVTINEAGGGL
ncbi:MAG: hypothetical protein JSW41_02100 [Candidatus Aenigmatarchaeota archaeon]|nr:MAG: hypothetical protein JSW41_02100 [Candidatus Aenigmarchaeota archaeon]